MAHDSYIEKTEYHVIVNGEALSWYDENEKAEAIAEAQALKQKEPQAAIQVDEVVYWGNTRKTIFEFDAEEES
jgi:hypothetical protein